MSVSAFDLFKIGIGPSSSHTVGPMVAARRFGEELEGLLPQVVRLEAELFGSLALTGKGHASDTAVILGLAGAIPATLDPDSVPAIVERVDRAHRLHGRARGGVRPRAAPPFPPSRTPALPFQRHGAVGLGCGRRPAGAAALFDRRRLCAGRGGGRAQCLRRNARALALASGADLLAMGEASRLAIPEMMLANELALRPLAEVEAGLDAIADTMAACMIAACAGRHAARRAEGAAPGQGAGSGAGRAAGQRAGRSAGGAGLDQPVGHGGERGKRRRRQGGDRPHQWRGGDHPGGAALLRALLSRRCGRAAALLLTAAAIGSLYKRNASISGAEVGCQGEVGVACSMAAAGLTAALGGTNTQIENAAEIGMEHNLGLTCDPVGGLVQIPCIERNAMGAVKAIDASRLAMLGDGGHVVSLDKVIETMRQTGATCATNTRKPRWAGWR
jgi:L-serine dehydratase